MSFTIHTQELPGGPAIPMPDEHKNDYQNALKRNLKIWAEWREVVNNVLAEGGTMQDAPPLERYLAQNDHPTKNPKTLLAYCASGDNITPLRKSTFLHYGIPRIKMAPSKDLSPRQSHKSPGDSGVTSPDVTAFPWEQERRWEQANSPRGDTFSPGPEQLHQENNGDMSPRRNYVNANNKSPFKFKELASKLEKALSPSPKATNTPSPRPVSPHGKPRWRDNNNNNSSPHPLQQQQQEYRQQQQHYQQQQQAYRHEAEAEDSARNNARHSKSFQALPGKMGSEVNREGERGGRVRLLYRSDSKKNATTSRPHSPQPRVTRSRPHSPQPHVTTSRPHSPRLTRVTYAQSAKLDPRPDYQDDGYDDDNYDYEGDNNFLPVEMLSEPAPDYRTHLGLQNSHGNGLQRSHDDLQQSHDQQHQRFDALQKSREGLQRSRRNLQKSSDNLHRLRDGGNVNNSREENLEGEDESNDAGRRYRGSVNVMDQNDGRRKTIQCDFYQP